MGIDHSEAIPIHDAAESGTKTFRDEFAHLTEMADRGEIRILAVDDQARLSRADNAFAFITDLVFSGGRFISTGEGIDTLQQGWELRVKVMELHNCTTIRELGRRVRRGQLGRVCGRIRPATSLTGTRLTISTRSWCVRTIAAPNRRRDSASTRPRPNGCGGSSTALTKVVDRSHLAGIDQAEGSGTSTQEWFEMDHSTRADDLGQREVFRRLALGETTTLRNSKGKVKQPLVPAGQGVTHQRPELRIIDQVVWEKAQQRLRELKDLFGCKVGQKPRGPKVHHLQVYPGSLLGGLVFCGLCGRRLWYHASGPRHDLACPNRGCGAGAWR